MQCVSFVHRFHTILEIGHDLIQNIDLFAGKLLLFCLCLNGQCTRTKNQNGPLSVDNLVGAILKLERENPEIFAVLSETREEDGRLPDVVVRKPWHAVP